MKVEIYCDGSATTYNKPGGYAYVIVVDGVKDVVGSGGLKNATNNVAELNAAVAGLNYVANNSKYAGADIELVSDSKLVLGYADGSYTCHKIHLALLHNQISTLFKKLNAKTRWVKGHTGDTYNEECDVLAKAERAKIEEEDK